MAAGAERAVARGIGRPEDCDHRNSQGRRQVHGAGIAADEQTGAARERNQLSERTGECFGRAAAGGFHGVREIFFSGAEVDQRFQTILQQLFCHLPVTFGRPLLRSPASARVEQYELLRAFRFEPLVALLLGGMVAWKLGPAVSSADGGQPLRRVTDSVPQCVRRQRLSDACKTWWPDFREAGPIRK